MKFWLWLPLSMLMLSPILWDRMNSRMDSVTEGGSGFPTSEGGSGFPTSEGGSGFPISEGGSGFPTK